MIFGQAARLNTHPTLIQRGVVCIGDPRTPSYPSSEQCKEPNPSQHCPWTAPVFCTPLPDGTFAARGPAGK